MHGEFLSRLRGECGETSKQGQTTDCAEESTKGDTGEGGIKEGGQGEERGAVATWNVRTLAVKGKNGLGYAETLLLRAQ